MLIVQYNIKHSSDVEKKTPKKKIAKKSANEQNVTVKFLVQDFFTFTEKFQNYFHLVYDYVTYCVIYPVRRKEYGKMIYDVLSCNGLFIALWFPVEKR